MPITITATTDSPKAELAALARFLQDLVGSQAAAAMSLAISQGSVVHSGVTAEAGSVVISDGAVAVRGETGPTVTLPPSVPPPTLVEPETVNATPPALDSQGLPWDERIHASSKSLNADGTWRFKRGVDKALVMSVGAELKVRMATAAAAPVPPPPTETAVVVPPPPTTVAEVPPPAPEPTSVVPPPPAAVPQVPQTFAQLMPHLTAAMQGGRLQMPAIIEACQKAGCPALPALAGMPHLVPMVYELLFGATDE